MQEVPWPFHWIAHHARHCVHPWSYHVWKHTAQVEPLFCCRESKSNKRQHIVEIWEIILTGNLFVVHLTLCSKIKYTTKFQPKMGFFEAMSILTLSCPREMSNFSKSLTMNRETTCDIPFKIYFLGCAINHTNRDGGGHILEWEKSKTKEEKHWKFSYSLYILGIPLNYSLMYSS